MSAKQVYTLRPLTKQEWAALTPVPPGHYRAQLTVGGEVLYLETHPTREAAEAELAETLAEFAEFHERYPYLPTVTESGIRQGGAQKPAGVISS